MTTMPVVQDDVVLPWHHFLDKLEAPSEYRREGQKRLYKERARLMVDAFRRGWPHMVQELLAKHRWQVPEGLEPHWVEPSRAVLWSEQIVRRRVSKNDAEGRQYWVVEEDHQGWFPTSHLPITTASQLAYYLKEGFRLRPPRDGVAVEAVISAELADALQRKVPVVEVIPHKFFCGRHPAQGRYGFALWEQYRQHCLHFKEALEEKPPQDILERAGHFTYYCLIHNVGYTNEAAAQRHIRQEMRQPGRAVHPTLQDMTLALPLEKGGAI